MADPVTWILGAIGVAAGAKALSSSRGHGRTDASMGAERMPNRGVLTPGRKEKFEAWMRSRGTPEDFYRASELFDRAGLPTHAKMLRARGDLRKASPETHRKHQEVIRAAISSGDPFKMEKIAEVAEEHFGMTISARKLREHARGVRQKMALQAGGEVGDFAVKGDGGNLASNTTMAGEQECAVTTTGGACAIGAKDDTAVPPPIAEVPMPPDPFARGA